MSDEDPNDDRTSGSEEILEDELESDADNSAAGSSRPSSTVPEGAGGGGWGAFGGGSGAGLNGGGSSSFAGEESRPSMGGFGRREKPPAVDIRGMATDLTNSGRPNAYLRGMLERNASGDHVFKGQWALGYDAFYGPTALKSDFEFKHKALDADETEIFPLAGKYEGWYKLRESSSVKKHDDKELYLAFNLNSSSGESYNVSGQGRNEYGQYTITGLLTDMVATTATLEIFRIYDLVQTPVQGQSQGMMQQQQAPLERKRLSKGPGDAGFSTAPTTRPKSTGGSSGGTKISTHRKSTGGGGGGMSINKASSGGGGLGGGSTGVGMSGAQMPKIISEKQASRCRTIIKSLRDSAGAAVAWFEKPVNEALAPNYREFIKQPMDLNTIEAKLRKRSYPALTDFVADVRLIFRNAMNYNQEGEPCYNDAQGCSRIFEEIWKKHCQDLKISYEDNLRTAAAGVAGGAGGGGRPLPKKKVFTNVGPRPLGIAPVAPLGGLTQQVSSGGGQLTDAMVIEYRQQIQTAARDLTRAEMERSKLQAELDIARERIQELEEELYALRGGSRPGGMSGDLMRGTSSSSRGPPSKGRGSTATAGGAPSAQASAPAPSQYTYGGGSEAVQVMREELKEWVSCLSEDPEYARFAQPFVELIQSLGIDCFDAEDEVTIDVDSYSEEVILTLHDYVRNVTNQGGDEGAVMVEETMPEQAQPQAEQAAATVNGHTEEEAAAKAQGSSSRVKRPRSDSQSEGGEEEAAAIARMEVDDGEPATTGEGPSVKKQKTPDEQVEVGVESKPTEGATAEGKGSDDNMAVDGNINKEEEEEEEEEEAPAAEEEEEEEVSGENAMAKWAVEGDEKKKKDEEGGEEQRQQAGAGDEGRSTEGGGAEGEGGSGGDSDLWDQARREKEEELRRAEEKKKQDALQEELLRMRKIEEAKKLLEATQKAAKEKQEEEERAAREAEEARKEDEARKKQAMEAAREAERLKRMNMMG